jgi:hypothetical protein
MSCCNQKRQLVSYTILDNPYQNPALKFIAGEPGGTDGALKTLEPNPDDSGVPFLAQAARSQDPVPFSYVYGTDVRAILANIVTVPPDPSSGTSYSLLALPKNAGSFWSVLAKGVVLKWDGKPVATNPHGLSQIGNTLYLLDYDSQKLYLLGTNELNGLLPGDYPLTQTPFDVGAEAGLPATAKGQAIIALKDTSGATFLFALYLDYDTSRDPPHRPGILVRLTARGSSITYAGKVNVGLNPQAIIPITDSNGKITLLIPCIGGIQQRGFTNGEDSTLMAVPAFDSTLTAATLLTGDSAEDPPTAYDICMAAAALRANDQGIVYILTGMYDTYQVFFSWRLYKTTVAKLLSASNLTLSQAVTNGILKVADEVEEDDGGYFWDILHDDGDNEAGDRLWFFQGTPLKVTLSRDYSTPSAVNYARGSGPGTIGGANVNMNGADLTSLTISHAEAGVSLRRGLQRLSPEIKAAALKAAQTRAAAAPEEEAAGK